MAKEKWKLCYVNDFDNYNENMLKLYFTPLPLDEQWGDDWDDAPYEHNAGTPYTQNYKAKCLGVWDGCSHYPEVEIKTLFIETPDWTQSLLTPRSGCDNSRYSVKDINSGMVPWVTIKENQKPNIYLRAGMEYNKVIKQCQEIGLTVYTRKEKRNGQTKSN